MSILARGGLVFEFYMGKYSIDFGLYSKYSPQDSGLNLCSWYSKHNCTRPSSAPPPSRVLWGAGWVEWRQEGKYVILKLQKSILLCCSRVTRCSTRTHTHLHPAPCLDTPERFAWINFPVFFNQALPKIQSQTCIAWRQDRSWFSKMSRDTNVSCSVGQLISILKPHTSKKRW